MTAQDIISMPDKWEYPWFAAWDLAFHTVAIAAVDISFAKQQLELLLNRRYLHPNGQLPAYEWNFSDVNPPVHAWATWFVYELEKATTGKGDRLFLERSFHKLMRNFGWWLNRKDADNRNIFQGGFLGLDNIGVFDRSAPLPGGGRIDQADGTAWMALYSQNMFQIAMELARENPALRRAGDRRCLRTGPGSPPRPTTSARRRWGCGTRKTASSTTCCDGRTAAPFRSRCARSSG